MTDLKHPLTKTVCQLDANGYYAGQTEADLSPLQADDGVYLLPAFTVDTAAPETKPGHAAYWDATAAEWQYRPDHRGQTVYSTTDGSAINIEQIGDYPPGTTTEPRPGSYHTWQEGKWAISAEATKRQLADAKAAKLAAAARAAQMFIAHAAGLDTVPVFEQATWSLQAAEAAAWAADNSTATPVLSGIAAARGVDVNELRSKALAKAQAFTGLSAHIAGQRQAFEDAINAAKDVAAVDGVNIHYTAPGL